MKTVFSLTMVCAVGCTGAPFETVLLQTDNDSGTPEAEITSPQTPEASSETSVTDGGTSEAEAHDVAADAATEETADAATDDATEATTDAVCVTPQPFQCGSYTASPLGQFCLLTFNGQLVWSGTPSQCSTCETYTCACIGPFAGCPHYSCTEDLGQVKVVCEQ